ncbi:MAG: MarR family transcriptional regulator [Gallionellaceae bacterium]|jgi:DNA-binding transcriptional regulator GbsR (MarR family)|nr:MarR family transcriptional regulator [Gallionellaceae bacterium]
MKMTSIAERFIQHWGDMGNAWGVNRTVAQIHALLFFHGRPLNAEEIGETLNVARSNVSTSLKELLAWDLIRVSRRPDDRRDYFETSSDVWELVRTIVRERKQREFDPTSALLRDLIDQPEFGDETPDTQDRVHETLRLMESIGIWSEEMLRLSPSTLDKILRMGASVQRFVRGNETR